MPATSEPAPGSVMPSAAILSPRMAGARKRCFWSPVPNFQIGGGGGPPWGPGAAARAARPPPPPPLRGEAPPHPPPPAPAVFDGVLDAEQPELRHPVEDLVGEPLRGLPLVGVRSQLLGDEAPDFRTQRLVFLPEGRDRPHSIV